ncbi:MAG TPA: tripartite tricarboxylate transporter substrate-binding protein [Xanthobacteraceae bacterium]
MGKWLLAAALAATFAMNGGATAQVYPSRPITLIVPFAPGGPTDITSRIIGEHMSRTLGQQLVIENVAGAGGTIGSTRTMRATPDGYTIQMGQMGTHAGSVGLYPKLPYKPDVDFEPIGLVVDQAVVIFARKDFPAKDLNEFVSYVKANGERLNVGHAGIGSISHFTCLLLDTMLDVKPAMVPFSGAGPAINALMGSQVDYMCDSISDVVQQIQGGTIKGYAVATPARNPALPNVPTTREAGLPEFQATGWYALFAPKATPKPILDKLTAALDKALDDENVRKRLTDLGCDVPGKERRGQEALAALVKSEIARWTPVIKAANVKIE